jgi:hypothetical protein
MDGSKKKTTSPRGDEKVVNMSIGLINLKDEKPGRFSRPRGSAHFGGP